MAGKGIYFWEWIKNKPAIQAGFNVGQKNLMGICFEILDSGFLVKFYLIENLGKIVCIS